MKSTIDKLLDWCEKGEKIHEDERKKHENGTCETVRGEHAIEQTKKEMYNLFAAKIKSLTKGE